MRARERRNPEIEHSSIGDGGTSTLLGGYGNPSMRVLSSMSSSSASERMRGSCTEKETFFLIFGGSGARAPGCEGGAERARLCVVGAVGVVSEEVEDVE